MVRTFGQTQPVLLEAPPPAPTQDIAAPKRASSYHGFLILAGAAILSLFWIGVSAAYVWGYWGPAVLAAPLALKAVIVAALVLPPLLFAAVALAVVSARRMRDASRALVQATDRLFAVDDTASAQAAHLARSVRRELDGLNAGLDSAFQRMRSLEGLLETQIASLDAVGARADVRAQTIAALLQQENQRLESLGDGLTQTAGQAAEMVAGRAAQLKATMESAQGALTMAAQALDAKTADFRAAVTTASQAPLDAARALEAQATKIQDVSDATMGRAEFLLARHEKHRAQMQEIMQALKGQGEAFAREAVWLKDVSQATAQAKQDARQLVSEAVRECERLLRAGGELGVQTEKIRSLLQDATRDLERHLLRLPALAQDEARRVRQAMAQETEQLMDLSARTILALQLRDPQMVSTPEAKLHVTPNDDGLKTLARKLAANPSAQAPSKAWDMKALLAAVDQGDTPTDKQD